MTNDDMVGFAEAWAACWEMYGKEPSDGVLMIAFEALRRYELSDITKALTRHINDPDAGQFYPKPADIVRNIDGSKQSRGMVAWSKVERAIRHVGHYKSVAFDDPIIHSVLYDMGGWLNVCQTSEDDLPFRAREFEKRYSSYVLNPPRNYPSHLIGAIEAYNSSHGYRYDPPVLIGDTDRALLVVQSGNSEFIGVTRDRAANHSALIGDAISKNNDA